MEVRILGPLEVWISGRRIELGGARAPKLLAALALEPDRTVPIGRLVDVLWDDDPPATAVRQVRNTAAAVRRLLGRPDVLRTDGPGYRLCTATLLLDTRVFDEQLTAAGDAVAAGDTEEAAATLRAALDLWRGNALAGIRSRILTGAAMRLDERRLGVLEQCLELELALGRHRELTAELAALVTEHPLRERFTAQLMLALYRNGRVGEALEAYRRLRERLSAELGLGTGPEVSGMQAAILRADPALNLPVPGRTGAAAAPRQLPADLPGFVGRSGPLAELESLPGGKCGPRVVAIDGVAGIGKTTLAVHFAHRVARLFPEGQIFVNLKGFDPDPLTAETVLGRVLRALGTDPTTLSSTVEHQVLLYRMLLAGRRVLIVLDNATSTEQVQPLLPAGRGNLIVITSRNPLPRLAVRPGVHRITLDPLAREEAMSLLRQAIGADRVRTEAGAAADLAELTGRLPLALRIAGEPAAARPSLPLEDFAAELRAEHDRLDACHTRDGNLRTLLSHSYRTLDASAARMFRLLGTNPGPDLGLPAAAALTGRSTSDTRRRLGLLVAAGLLGEPVPGRYRWHDLPRTYAGELAREIDSAGYRRDAAHRLLDFYLHTAHRAHLRLRRLDARIPLGAPLPGVQPVMFTSHRQAIDWCESERDNLVAAVRLAARQGFDEYAWRLPCVLWEFFNLRKHRADCIATHEVGLAAARRLGNRYAEGRVLSGLASAHGDQGRHHAALGYYGELLRITTQTGDRCAQAAALHNVGVTHRSLGRYGSALGYFHRVLTLEREIGEPDEGTVLTDIGECYRNLGRHQDALGHYQRALAIHRAGNEPRGQATALHGLADCHRDLGRYAEAATHYRTALALRQAPHNPHPTPHTPHPETQLLFAELIPTKPTPGLSA